MRRLLCSWAQPAVDWYISQKRENKRKEEKKEVENGQGGGGRATYGDNATLVHSFVMRGVRAT